MKTLWVYGDSFAVDWGADWSWHRLVAQGLEVERAVNQTQAGCANTYSLSKFKADPHEPTDIVIFCVTESTRHWFVKEQPELANYRTINQSSISFAYRNAYPVQHEAIMSYYHHLQNTYLDDLARECQVSWLFDQGKQREIKMLVVPSFPLADLKYPKGETQFNGSLDTVCMNEFETYQDQLEWYNQGVDSRANHLVRDNHEILAAKIIAAVREGIDVDLNEGFKSKFLRSKDKHTHPGLLDSLVKESLEADNEWSEKVFLKNKF